MNPFSRAGAKERLGTFSGATLGGWVPGIRNDLRVFDPSQAAQSDGVCIDNPGPPDGPFTAILTSPSYVISGTGFLNLNIGGTGFAPGLTAQLNGIPHPIRYVSPTVATMPLSVRDQQVPGVSVITLMNTDGTSASVNLPVLYVPGDMLANSQVSLGDPSRLQAVIHKLESGEPVTIAAIGGGITGGGLASNVNHDFMHEFKAMLHRLYPLAPIALINAGIGSTASDYGSLRLAHDVLNQRPKPDLVIVEFAVNDLFGGSRSEYQQTFEGLLRQLIAAPGQPAVMVLETMQYMKPLDSDGNSTEAWEAPIAQYYNLPIMSYYDAIRPELESGNLTIPEISPDGHYPNDMVYAYISLFLTSMIQAEAPAPPLTAQPEPAPLYASTFETTSLVQGIGGMGAALNPTANSGFMPQPGFVAPRPCSPPEGYEASAVGSSIDFTVNGTDIIIGYWACNGPMGRAQVYVDGVLTPGVLDGYMAIPCAYERRFSLVASGLAPAQHAVHIVTVVRNKLSTGDTFRVLVVGTGR